MIIKASRIATGRTRNNLAFPDRSLMDPTFSTRSSNSNARKNVATHGNAKALDNTAHNLLSLHMEMQRP